MTAFALICLLAGPMPQTSTTETLAGKCVAIADGDTLTLLTADKRQVKVRLEGIDAPEKKQPFGNEARQALAELTFGKKISVRISGTDRYGRTLGIVTADRADVNAEMVRRGLAWHYKQFSKDPTLARLETEAREKKIGLWSRSDPVPPWEFRKKK